MQHKNAEYFFRIEKYINDYYIKHRCIPVNYQIARDLSLSTATISRYINQMKRDGRLLVDKNRKTKTHKIQKIVNANIEIPVVGAIACGTPILAEENIETYIIVSNEITQDREFFFLRTKGESMINAGINGGDLVLIRKQEFAENGDIAAVLLDDEATLKRIFFERNGKVRLHPENNNMKDFYVDECQVQGVAVKVVKDIN